MRRAAAVAVALFLGACAGAKARKPAPSPEAVTVAFCQTDFNGGDVSRFRADGQSAPADDVVTVVSTFTMTGSFSAGSQARVIVRFEALGRAAGAGFTKDRTTTRVEFLLSRNIDGLWEIDGPPYERRWSPAATAARLRESARTPPERVDGDDLNRAADEIGALQP